jgi:surface carbohydrate biosynthesis protein
VYLAKDMTPQSMEMLRIVNDLGHEITAWDEEALLHLPPEVHFRKRMSPLALECVSHLFAWGDENADLWRRFPGFEQARVHVTGNPRADLWRPEIRAYFENDASERRRENGDFLLVNTNFPLINSNRALFRPASRPGDEPEQGRGGFGMTRDFAERMWHHKFAVLESFQRLIPELERAFPDLNIRSIARSKALASESG